jgi:hypothetical protein
MNNLNKVVKGFQNNAGVRIPTTLPKPTSMGSGGGGGTRPLPGMEQIKGKSQVQNERIDLAKGRVENFRENLNKANAKVNDIKKSGGSKTELAKAQNDAAKIRSQWKESKKSLNSVQKNKMSWGKKEYE